MRPNLLYPSSLFLLNGWKMEAIITILGGRVWFFPFPYYRTILGKFITSTCCRLWATSKRHGKQVCSKFWLCRRDGCILGPLWDIFHLFCIFVGDIVVLAKGRMCATNCKHICIRTNKRTNRQTDGQWNRRTCLGAFRIWNFTGFVKLASALYKGIEKKLTFNAL